jgi:hypothetical protein
VPAVLMVSTIRFRSFKTLDSRARRPYTVLIFLAAGIVLIATHPQAALVVIAYGYLASGFIGLAITRFRRRGASSSPGAMEADQPAVPDRRDSAAGCLPLRQCGPPGPPDTAGLKACTTAEDDVNAAEHAEKSDLCGLCGLCVLFVVTPSAG